MGQAKQLLLPRYFASQNFSGLPLSYVGTEKSSDFLVLEVGFAPTKPYGASFTDWCNCLLCHSSNQGIFYHNFLV